MTTPDQMALRPPRAILVHKTLIDAAVAEVVAEAGKPTLTKKYANHMITISKQTGND